MNAVEIKKLRKQLGLNQVEFAQLTGVHPITVSKWERSEATPTPYQAALFGQFQEGARDKEVRSTLRTVLIAAGVILALALLLRHLMKKK
jgi:transcriptional regulator with XRE-family HTH domain